ncbi:HTH-type transcriptional regulator BhcR [Phaeovulum sp.]|uniref:HTH-type transcriptional regulator BhcR n=1 Tax=Phaeovulum sp. TaxID=2934796 RepID=UPI0039E6CE9F
MVVRPRTRGRPKSFDGDETQNVIQSLDRAIDVLETLASGGSMTLSDIAKALDQSAATIYRVLTTFQLRNMAEVSPTTQEWSIGPRAFRIGATFLRRSNVTARALPAMRHLMEATNETSNLGIENLGLVMFIGQVETHESIRAFFPPGTQGPMHASGIGKALLSTYSKERLDRLLATSTLEQFTPQTIVTRDHLQAELQQIRAQGFAFDNEEKAIGMRCIAAPILNYQGEAVAGISISGPSHRVTPEKVAQIGALVRAAGEEVSRSLGADIA